MVLEAAVVKVGEAVGKHVGQAWLAGRTAEQRRGKDLVELIQARFPDRIARRRTERQLADIADQVTDRLLTLCAHEYRGLTDNDKAATLAEVVHTLTAADLSDATLFAADADPVRLAGQVRARLPKRRARRELGEAGAHLYDVVLDECCACLVRLVQELPQFGPRADAERFQAFEGADALDSPRRTLLGAVLVEAVRAAGAEVREHVRVEEFVWSEGRVVGVRGSERGGRRVTETARLFIGADGKRSMVAEAAGAWCYRERPVRSFASYTYWSGLPIGAGEMYQRPGDVVAAFSTNDDLVMVYVATPIAQFGAACGYSKGITSKRSTPAVTWASGSVRPCTPSGCAPPPTSRTRSVCRTDQAGRWSATPELSWTRSRPRASPTRCGRRVPQRGRRQWVGRRPRRARRRAGRIPPAPGPGRPPDVRLHGRHGRLPARPGRAPLPHLPAGRPAEIERFLGVFAGIHPPGGYFSPLNALRHARPPGPDRPRPRRAAPIGRPALMRR